MKPSKIYEVVKNTISKTLRERGEWIHEDTVVVVAARVTQNVMNEFYFEGGNADFEVEEATAPMIDGEETPEEVEWLRVIRTRTTKREIRKL